MSTFDLLAELPIEVDDYTLEGLRSDVSGGFERQTTVVHLTGGGLEGVGEDVVYDPEEHVAFQQAGPVHAGTLSGRFALGDFCDLVDSLDLFPVEPKREVSRLYRRWTFHSAALDLALAQAGQPLHAALRREPQPVTFVVSLRLGEPPSLEPLQRRLGRYPKLHFKLDPTSSWTEDLIDALVRTHAVDSVDFKSLYRGTIVDQPSDPVLYARVVEAFPDAWIEPPEDGQPQAVADGRAAQSVRRLRLLRRARHRRLQRRAVRARAGAQPGPVSGLAVPSRHAQRPRAGGLQREGPASRPAGQPAAARSVKDRLPLGGHLNAGLGRNYVHAEVSSQEARVTDRPLDGAVALVTGASSGIGEATALALAAHGATVAIAARRRDRLESLAERLEGNGATALVIEADLTDPTQAEAAINRTAAELGRLDILVNNAGMMLLGPVVDADTTQWWRMLDINVNALLYCANAALPHLLDAAQDGPRNVADMVNVSSVAGRTVRRGSAVYNLTKHGVGAFSESLRQEVAGRHVRVSLVEPGATATELRSHNTQEIRDMQAQRFAGVRTMDADDIADAILYIVTRPWHVAVNEILIRPTEQAD